MKMGSYRFALSIYVLLFSLLTSAYWWKGEVVAPYRQHSEVSLYDNSDTNHIENRKFSDFGNFYIPEISGHLSGPRSGWISLWAAQNELGRPIFHTFGYSPAYFPSWVISKLTNNPWRYITVMSLLTCFFAGIFIILYCREIGLSPLAGLIAGISMATSPQFMYWLSFPMFPAILCWAAGALWGVTRIAKRPDFVGWSVLAFSVYSLLMTAYIQPLVFHAYILAGYGMYLVYHKQRFGWIEVGRFMALSASALIVGVALVLPVYIDLARIAAESSRVAPDPSFYTAVLPSFSSWVDVWRFFVLSTVPELFGNPIESEYPFLYDGLSVTPLIIFFAIIGLTVSFKQTWGWWLAIVVLCLFAFVHPLYILGVKYFGFNISRSSPLGSIMLPLTIIVAYGVNSLSQRTILGGCSRIVLFSAFGVLAVLAIGLAFGVSNEVSIRWSMVLGILIAAVLLIMQYQKTHPTLLVAALIVVMVTISYPLMLRQNLETIATTSPLVEGVRSKLHNGSRFAISKPGLLELPPNLNANLGLKSTHSYNSLSPISYHKLISELGGEMHSYGRWNASIDPDYQSVAFWMSNIGLVLSSKALLNDNLVFVDKFGDVYLYHVDSRIGCCIRVSQPNNMSSSGIQDIDPRVMESLQISKTEDRGDYLAFDVSEDEASLLILSQKFHRDWRARVLTNKGWLEAKTIPVNGVFQGVLLPKGVTKLELQFEPFAKHMWIVHIFWLCVLLITIISGWKRDMTQVNKKSYV